MTNQYQILKDRQQKEFNAFPMSAAFSQQQFAEMMAKWGLLPTDTDKIVHIGGGCYIRKTDREAFRVLVENHEYCITYDLEDTLDAVGLTVDEINADKRLLGGLEKALSQYLKDSENY